MRRGIKDVAVGVGLALALTGCGGKQMAEVADTGYEHVVDSALGGAGPEGAKHAVLDCVASQFPGKPGVLTTESPQVLAQYTAVSKINASQQPGVKYTLGEALADTILKATIYESRGRTFTDGRQGRAGLCSAALLSGALSKSPDCFNDYETWLGMERSLREMPGLRTDIGNEGSPRAVQAGAIANFCSIAIANAVDNGGITSITVPTMPSK